MKYEELAKAYKDKDMLIPYDKETVIGWLDRMIEVNEQARNLFNQNRGQVGFGLLNKTFKEYAKEVRLCGWYRDKELQVYQNIEVLAEALGIGMLLEHKTVGEKEFVVTSFYYKGYLIYQYDPVVGE